MSANVPAVRWGRSRVCRASFAGEAVGNSSLTYAGGGPKGTAAVAKTKVLLADDHRLMLEAVRFALDEDGDFEIVAATTEATKVLPLVVEHTPDVVVLDVRMPQLD